MTRSPIHSVQVNLVLGFLGVGKTTAIRHLLGHRPQGERWAVLVNEFGEIGVDARLLDDTGIAVKQIPGGCMCCAAGPVTRVALNSLLRQERPDRLLIEPSGLGHPADILRLLQGPEYQGVLQVASVITLLDPRHLVQSRYQTHPLFRDQLRLADYLACNKTDLCSTDTVDAAQDWLQARLDENERPGATVELVRISDGKVPVHWLYGRRPEPPEWAAEEPVGLPAVELDWRSRQALPTPGQWLSASHSADGFHSIGWRVHPDECWSADALLSWLPGLRVRRVKGVLNTDRGWLWFNMTEGDLSAGECDPQEEGVIELIDDEPLAAEKLRRSLSAVKIDSGSGP